MLGMLGMGGRNPWGFDPLDYLLYAVFSAVVYALLGWHWWTVVVLVASLLLWPRAVRLVRGAWRGARVGARTAGLRKAGLLYCAECGGELGPETVGRVFATQACAGCGGKWTPAPSLTSGLAQKGRPAPDWGPRQDLATDLTRICPRCAKAMPAGAFRGVPGTSFRCGDCDGWWFDRVDWVSFELG